MMNSEMVKEICRAIAIYGKITVMEAYNFTKEDYKDFVTENATEIMQQAERWNAINESN